MECTEDDFIQLGLETAGITRWARCKRSRNLVRFQEKFGASALTCRQMWKDLIALEEVDETSNPLHLLVALRFLFKYHTENDIVDFFRPRIETEFTLRKCIKLHIPKLQKLLKLKMVDFDEADDGLVFFLTVDGTHCRIQEPRPFSTIWSSFKFGGSAGLNYEIGLCIHKDKLAWLCGPTPPGLSNDLQVAREALLPELRAHRERTGEERRLIADSIHFAEDEDDLISARNEFDPPGLAELKDGASSRHEAFNSQLKNWNVLVSAFRHDLDFHKPCFESVAAICCYQNDNGSYGMWDSYPDTRHLRH